MSETVYIETSILGYLTARSSRDLVVAANIEITREWWDTRRNDFQLYSSQAVVRDFQGINYSTKIKSPYFHKNDNHLAAPFNRVAVALSKLFSESVNAIDTQTIQKLKPYIIELTIKRGVRVADGGSSYNDYHY